MKKVFEYDKRQIKFLILFAFFNLSYEGDSPNTLLIFFQYNFFFPAPPFYKKQYGTYVLEKKKKYF